MEFVVRLHLKVNKQYAKSYDKVNKFFTDYGFNSLIFIFILIMIFRYLIFNRFTEFI